jgi:hypothetical protein
VTPEQALQILGQVVAGTRALPHEIDAMREALAVLQAVVTNRPPKEDT